MHISIYGVGRSGTKAIQLYLSYLLAQKHGQVWINFEPYFGSIKTNFVNYEGFIIIQLHHIFWRMHQNYPADIYDF